jgi:hypothetical protein
MRCGRISTSYHEFALPLAAAVIFLAGFDATPVKAQQPPPATAELQADLSHVPPRSSSSEIIGAGHHFGGVYKGNASIVEKAAGQWGQPNGYILGKEAGEHSSAASARAAARYTKKLATCGCSGRRERSASMLESMARAL